MKKQYTITDIGRFFEQFKQLPEYYEFDEVHPLINNPEAKAKWKGKTSFNLLKFIIMTSVFITGVTVLLLWTTPNKNHKLVNESVPTVSGRIENVTRAGTGKQTVCLLKPPIKKKQGELSKQKDDVGQKVSDVAKLPPVESLKLSGNTSDKINDCTWPKDTVLDKHKLFVYLSNEEILKLGVFIYKKDSVYYYNRTPDGKSNIGRNCNTMNDKNKFTTYAFYSADGSDTACTSHRWGDKFYQQIDTLIPVISVLDSGQITWFTPHKSIFAALPERYRYLENVYDHLLCLKKQSPNHQFVNYWDPKRNIVLDKINYLILNRQELQHIGVGIFKDSISLADPTNSFRYLLNDRLLNCGTYYANGSVPPEIPNMFPTLLTDIKGLNQGMYGRWIKNNLKQKGNNSGSEIFNTLIPVYFPISEFIRELHYDLVLWYYPTSDFLEALPERYRDEIKSEIGYINSGLKSGSSSCTYFEACKSTLTMEDGVKVYPNPASESATIEFSLKEELSGKISLVSISGSEIKLLVPQTKFMAGFQTHTLNLSNTAPGIYMISIITDKGFKTQRIIISK